MAKVKRLHGISSAATAPALVPQGREAERPPISIARRFTLIGSHRSAHLRLINDTVSRIHACIIVTEAGVHLRDLASRRGVIINGKQVKDEDLHHGDTVQIGRFVFKFSDPGSSSRTGSTPQAAVGRLVLGEAVQTPIDMRTLLIGRRGSADIPVSENSVSHAHALIFEDDGQRIVRDLGSRTGTFVNGKTVHHHILNFGDKIRIGETTFDYLPASVQQPSPEEASPTDPASSFVVNTFTTRADFGLVEPSDGQKSVSGLENFSLSAISQPNASDVEELAAIGTDDRDTLPREIDPIAALMARFTNGPCVHSEAILRFAELANQLPEKIPNPIDERSQSQQW